LIKIVLSVPRPDGHLYDKEAILENILHQKIEITKKTKEFERQKVKQLVSIKFVIYIALCSSSEQFCYSIFNKYCITLLHFKTI